jgi:hypothetical protein
MKPFTEPKLPTTAGSEFSSLTEDPVFGEKRRLWREMVEISVVESLTPSFLRYRNSPPFHFFGTSACRLGYFPVARHPSKKA